MGSLLQQGTEAPLVEDLTGLAPWDVCLRLANLPHLLFFDSAQTSALGRYSYVTADPFQWLTCSSGDVGVEPRRSGRPSPPKPH